MKRVPRPTSVISQVTRYLCMEMCLPFLLRGHVRHSVAVGLQLTLARILFSSDVMVQREIDRHLDCDKKVQHIVIPRNLCYIKIQLSVVQSPHNNSRSLNAAPS